MQKKNCYIVRKWLATGLSVTSTRRKHCAISDEKTLTKKEMNLKKKNEELKLELIKDTAQQNKNNRNKSTQTEEI